MHINNEQSCVFNTLILLWFEKVLGTGIHWFRTWYPCDIHAPGTRGRLYEYTDAALCWRPCHTNEQVSIGNLSQSPR